MIFLLLFIPLLLQAQVIKVDTKTMETLGIRVQKVKLTEEAKEVSFPAVLDWDKSATHEVYSPLEGIVKKLYVKEGSFVKRGQLLAEVFSPRLAELNAQIRMAQVKLKTAEENLKREELLYKEEVIPYARYFSAKVEYEKAKSEYSALLKNLSSFGEVRGNNLLLRSPIEGIVLEQKVASGSSVDLQKPLFKLQDTSKLWAYAYTDPTFSVKDVKAVFIEFEGNRYSAKIDWVSPQLDPQTGKQVIRLSLRAPLKAGLKTRAVFSFGKYRGVWLPVQALQKVKGREVVFVKDKEGFKVYPVKALIEKDGLVLVEGLKEGQEVAVSGTIFLKAQAER